MFCHVPIKALQSNPGYDANLPPGGRVRLV